MEYVTNFTKNWDTIENELLDIINVMYLEVLLSETQKHGHIVCLPKIGSPANPKNYRRLTIFNTDYKIFTRIIADRLRTRMEEVLHHIQYCWRNDKSIYDAVATVRDIIGYAEDTQKPIFLLSIDFNDAFDKISHTFLLHILREYGISDTFCKYGISDTFCECGIRDTFCKYGISDTFCKYGISDTFCKYGISDTFCKCCISDTF